METNSLQGQNSTVERNFDIAVSLVKSLPQKGPFQPSYSEAGKIYSYFKQSKFGPCNQPKPGFWDVVNRAKWEVWSGLGDLPQEEAMKCYVEEIKNENGTSQDVDVKNQVFTRIRQIEEFAEKEHHYAETLIPFCEVTGLKLTEKLQEIVDSRKTNIETVEPEENIDSIETKEDGLSNSSEENKADEIETSKTDEEQTSVKLTINENHEHSVIFQNTLNTDTTELNENPVPKNQESQDETFAENEDGSSSESENEIYCDSLGPDQIAKISNPTASPQKTSRETLSTPLKKAQPNQSPRHNDNTVQQQHTQSTPCEQPSSKSSNDFEFLPKTSQIKKEIREKRKSVGERLHNSSSTSSSSSSSKGFEIITECRYSKSEEENDSGKNNDDHKKSKDHNYDGDDDDDDDDVWCTCKRSQRDDRVGTQIVKTLERLEENMKNIVQRMDDINKHLKQRSEKPGTVDKVKARRRSDHVGTTSCADSN